MNKILCRARQIAPNDATHYSHEGIKHICFFYVEDGIALYMSVNDGVWFDCTNTDFSWEIENNEIMRLW